MKIFDEHHDMFRQVVRAFVQKEVEPHVEEWEEAGQIPKSIWPRMGELGFLGVEYDEKYGGGRAPAPPPPGLCAEMAPAPSAPPAPPGRAAPPTGPPPPPRPPGGPPPA